MFRDTRAFSGFAVPDTDAAKDFYGGTLGLEVTEEDGLLALHVAGGRPVLIYPKPDHEPATYTILNFPVDDIDRAVDDLPPPGSSSSRTPAARDRREGRLPQAGPPIAWFRDPAGNILAVLEAPDPA